jgi:four helix bundle protein
MPVKRAIEEDFPIVEINRLAVPERNSFKPIYQMHKWFARRASCVFRAILLAGTVKDFKLKSQFTDAAQSAPANVAEGYGRRTLPEYLQYLYISKGSLAEALTRASGLWRVKLISDADFEQFDTLHYEVENKLLKLIESLEAKRGTGEWSDTLPHQSINPSIQ